MSQLEWHGRDNVSSGIYLKGYVTNPTRNTLCPMPLSDIRCRPREAERDENERMRKEEDGLVPGNSTEWRNNVSYVTFPGWRAMGRERVGNSEIPVKNGERWRTGREKEKERKKEREAKKTERWKMQSLSGMQLGGNTTLAELSLLLVHHPLPVFSSMGFLCASFFLRFSRFSSRTSTYTFAVLLRYVMHTIFAIILITGSQRTLQIMTWLESVTERRRWESTDFLLFLLS